MKRVPRYPHRKHWERLKEIDSHSLEPGEFLERWRVTHADLARICSVSKATVDSWFSQGSKHRDARPEHKRRLFCADREWNAISLEDIRA
jgi:hypothetical protein